MPAPFLRSGVDYSVHLLPLPRPLELLDDEFEDEFEEEFEDEFEDEFDDEFEEPFDELLEELFEDELPATCKRSSLGFLLSPRSSRSASSVPCRS